MNEAGKEGVLLVSLGTVAELSEPLTCRINLCMLNHAMHTQYRDAVRRPEAARMTATDRMQSLSTRTPHMYRCCMLS